MDKVSNRSMDNVWSLLKISLKKTSTIFLLLTLNKFHASFGELKWWYGSYLCNFFWLKLCNQYLLRHIMYYSLTYSKEDTKLVGLLKLKLQTWVYRQVTTDPFPFPEEIFKRKTSLGCWLFLKKWNNQSVII